MPELPEVEVTKRGVEPYILQQKIKKVDIRQAKLRYMIPVQMADEIIGQQLQKIRRIAKYLLLDFESGSLLIHLGMSGSLRIIQDMNLKPQKHEHIDFIFNNDVILRYRDPRRFGIIDWIPLAEIIQHPLLVRLGIEPFDVKFTGSFLFNKTRKTQRAIKTFLMDANIVVGIGNIYASEALFRSGILPFRASSSLNLHECELLVKSIKEILQLAIEAGGSSLKDFVNSSGEKGYFQQQYYVYGRKNEHCKICSTLISSQFINQRNSFFCESCQH